MAISAIGTVGRGGPTVEAFGDANAGVNGGGGGGCPPGAVGGRGSGG